MKALNRGFYLTTALAMAGFYVAVHFLLEPTAAAATPGTTSSGSSARA